MITKKLMASRACCDRRTDKYMTSIVLRNQLVSKIESEHKLTIGWYYCNGMVGRLAGGETSAEWRTGRTLTR
jgi:hypothetical protein